VNDDRRVTPGWLRAVSLALVGLALGVVAWLPMFQLYPQTPELDGRYVLQQFEIGKATVARYHELPLWNPFDCRGIPMWDHPESMTGSPLLLALTHVDGTKTLIIWNLFHMVVGFIGMWLLARDELKLSREASFIAATAWAYGMNHTAQYAGAHSTFVTFWFVPLLLFLWRRAEESLNSAIGLGALLALMIYNGGTYPTPFCVLFLCIETLTRVRPLKRLLKILRAGAVVGAVSIGLAASRLLPLLDQFKLHTRTMDPEWDHLWRYATLKNMFTWRMPLWSERQVGQQYVWAEYNSYIGWILLTLALIGIVVALFEARWTLFVGLAVFVIMLGHFHDRAPWTLIHKYVPPYKSMRVPSRFRHILMAFLALWIALAVDRVPSLLKRVWTGLWPAGPPPRWLPTFDGLRLVLLGAAMLGVGEMVGLGMDSVAPRFQGAPLKLVTPSPRFYYEGEHLTPDWVDQPRQNRAWSGCRSYEWPANQNAPIWFGDLTPARPSEAADATVLGAKRTVNTFTVDVDAKKPTRIYLNSGHAEGWRTNVGTMVSTVDGLLSVDVPAGRHHLHIRYWPKKLTLGFWLTGLTAAGVLLVLLRDPLRALRRRWKTRAAA